MLLIAYSGICFSCADLQWCCFLKSYLQLRLRCLSRPFAQYSSAKIEYLQAFQFVSCSSQAREDVVAEPNPSQSACSKIAQLGLGTQLALHCLACSDSLLHLAQTAPSVVQALRYEFSKKESLERHLVALPLSRLPGDSLPCRSEMSPCQEFLSQVFSRGLDSQRLAFRILPSSSSGFPHALLGWLFGNNRMTEGFNKFGVSKK